ncbi:lipopolysaccharide assembly protein LapB [Streptomyces sp. CoH27]|uniref:tetratricopeptide repeat protein n=1 Tax=Streptomyces sp. CoH27 TaxID=2875763 RepID=UPI001CD6B854|nr:tetratricopeptide repeat protein [Streptomyces sp. CoH27]
MGPRAKDEDEVEVEMDGSRVNRADDTTPGPAPAGTGERSAAGTPPCQDSREASSGDTGTTDDTGEPSAPTSHEHTLRDTGPSATEEPSAVGSAEPAPSDSGDRSPSGSAEHSSHGAEISSAPRSAEPTPSDPGDRSPSGSTAHPPHDAEISPASRSTEPTPSNPEDRSPSGSSAHPPLGPDAPSAADPDGRVAAVHRVAAAGRRWRALQLGGSAMLLALALTGGAIAVGADRSPASVAAASSAVDPGVLGSGNLDASIAALQAHLRTQPKDSGSWATLGLAYVEQARTKGDPSRYPQADKALSRSLALTPDNDQALAGRAALAAARHDFADALTYADLALRQNPYSERALSSRIDALVELGRYPEASQAAETADTRKPGVPVFTRYAYVHELRGDVTTARRVLQQALSSATTPGDIAYVSTQLGQLAWNQGDYRTALTSYARALAADDTYLPALEGQARAQAASGDRAAAIKGMETVVSRYPLPGPLVELGELYEARGAAGDRARAKEQYALVEAWISLARANGVNADLDTALAAADHGDKAAALRAARAEWARRHTVHTADALAWALHVNGQDAQALGYARQATATGYRNAAFLYHRGMIELATGHRTAGRASLASALKLNPGFSPLGAAEARKALEATK